MKVYKVTSALLVIIIASVFALGWVGNDWYAEYQKPEKLIHFEEQIGPSGIIEWNDIVKVSGGVKIKEVSLVPLLMNPEHSTSMLPFMDSKTTVLATEEFDFDDLKIGDIVIYEDDGFNIAHAIMSIEVDEKGKYLVMRGYNNYILDSLKVRKENIKYLVTGVLYGEAKQ